MNSIQESLDSFLYSVQEYNFDNPITLTNIIDNLESLSKNTNTLDYLPLNNIALLLQDNLLCIYEEHKTLTIQEYSYLKEWPLMFEKYFNNTDQEANVNSILANLSNEIWPIPIEKNDCQVLKELLLTPLELDMVDDSHSASKQNEQEVLDNTVSVLATTLSKIITQDSNILTHFKHKIEALSELSDNNELLGFNDICLIILDNISLLSDDIDNISDTQMTLIASWLGLANKYIETPKNSEYASALIDNISNKHWPSPLNDEDKSILIGFLGIKPKDKTDIEYPKVSFKQTTTKLKNLISAYDNSDTKNNEVNETIHQLIRLSVDENLFELEKIFLHYQILFNDSVTLNKPLPYSHIQHLMQFPELIHSYYSANDKTHSINALIEYLEQDFETSLSSIKTEIPTSLLNNALSDDEEINTSEEKIKDHVYENSVSHSNNEEPNNITEISSELIEMLISEIVSISDEISDLIPDADEPLEIKKDKLSQFHIRIERFSNASQAAELIGLYNSNTLFLKNLEEILLKDNLSSEVLDFLKDWLLINYNYLNDLDNNLYSKHIVDQLNNELSPISLSHEAYQHLINSLSSVRKINAVENQENIYETDINEDELSITVTDAINADLLDGLLQELPQQTYELSKAIQLLCDNNPDIKTLEKAQRIAHTIKGAANTVGIKGIAYLTHKLEDLFSILSKHNKTPSNNLSKTLIQASDCLEEMTDSLMQRQESPAYTKHIAEDIVNWLNRLQTEGVDILDSSEDISSTDTPQEDTKTTKEHIVENEINDSKNKEKPIENISVPIKIIDDLIRLIGESMIYNLQLNEKIESTIEKSDNLKSQNNLTREISYELERFIEISGNALTKQKTVNESEFFDPLELEEYNQLHTTSNQIIETATDANEINTDIESELKNISEMLYSQTNIQQEIYDISLKCRMLPIRSVVPRLERCVRQTCRTLNKKAELTVIGTDTLIDRSILNKILEPLMHMLRNSIDHGIEFPQDRIAKGKPETGNIKIEINRIGTKISIVLNDDGAGLNKDKIKHVAEKNNIITVHEELSENDIYRLILQPGFSTKEAVSQTSGRGIGMDVVYSEILSLNGRLNIESFNNKGLRIELILPASLLTSHAVFIEHNHQTLAISNHDIIRILHPDDVEIIDSNKDQVFVDDELLDFYTIDYLIDGVKPDMTRTNNTRPALLINFENTKIVLFINDITDSKNIVIKNMGDYLNNIPGIVGATIVGDGSVVPVIDASDLLRQKQLDQTYATLNLTNSTLIKALPIIMIIDDSISTRRALSQIVQDSGFDVVTAKDGLEAVGKLDTIKPSVILVDFEMPRMNGIEFTMHVKGINGLKQIPVIMISSRTTDKHIKLAYDAGVNKYITKPFSEDILLDDIASFLNEDV